MKPMTSISVAAVAMGVASTLAAAPAWSDAGRGWDMFDAHQGERIVHAAPSQPASSGFDIFQMRLGEPVHVAAYQGAAQSKAGRGWDIYQTGGGDPIR